LNRAQIFTEQVVGLTEVALALAMIGILIWRPGGLFAAAEIGMPRPWRRAPAEAAARPYSSTPTDEASP
jgi:branched-chain amino acid transport system permease protein